MEAKVGTSKGGGKKWQPTLKNLSGGSVPEPYQSPDWALVPAQLDYGLNSKKKKKR
jgi:hypothetical protein